MNELNNWCNLSVLFDFCAMKHIINKLAPVSIPDNICEAKIWKINKNEFLLTSIHVCVFYFIIRIGKKGKRKRYYGAERQDLSQ